MLRFLTLLLCTVTFLGMKSDTIVLVDNFNEGNLNDWEGRKSDFSDIYEIAELDDEHFLSARSLDSHNFIIKSFKVDIVKFPYLNWKWRALSLPVNGDESRKETCDVAASVNVVLRASKWRPRTIKYSWSTTLPVDSCFVSPFSMWPARADVKVIKSGGEELGNWRAEKVNVLEDYKKFYKKEKVASFVIEAIVIMTDSDNTESPSAADYDDIFFSHE